MGREVRRVPADWRHPRYPNDYYQHHLRGRYISLHEEGFTQAESEWTLGFAKWQEGFVQDWFSNGWKPKGPEHVGRFTEYYGSRPSQDDYMPEWTEEQKTHLMMYENTSEGTPISQAFATAEELARWLADNGASAFADQTASYEEWLATIKQGWSVSAVLQDGALQSGVAFNNR